MAETSTTYAQNYQTLEQINAKLQSGQNNPNIIDELAPMLESASKSYQVCKARIYAAEKFVAEFETGSNAKD
ncbi:exodeoxyribonuclease VII small subunit [Cysteiniphilum halobium]|uniref:exodeoxyribonuclease VII small subunit n=1 Tax=Cysteiniphilum halobium TaxID=2219059 RepID=UPI000E6594EB|nr:exodeoxyribonuclease VII small subunit [Cysteiniphilum halobium]